MSDFLIVLLKIASMFLVMALGWVARKRALITDNAGRVLSRLLVDMIFPAMVFTQMLRTVNPQVLRESWFVPILGAAVIVIAKVVGQLGMPLFRHKGALATAVFLVAMPNWVFFPLPIVEKLFGDAGVRDVLLCNVGAQLMLWTIGVWTLRGTMPRKVAFKELAMNHGLVATVAGIVIALVLPFTRTLETVAVAGASVGVLASASVVQALAMLGSLTIPLSLVITGSQLGSLNLADHYPTRDFVGVIVLRLLVAPAITIAIFTAAILLGLRIPEVTRMTTYLIAAMPVAISCSIVTERFGGDTPLAARAIFYSTLGSILTVPVLYYLVRLLGL
ncbi:MAG: AEC family transporter [Verrucomicrobia bacterium]|nr:AEC family transporter [Verrucomicrobiota bacterium]MBU1736461.1 AEC family transporter [Verrucomicrobiota bacterium]MBU1857228.1 AEC family transporter [Verrucomicrobiota bacterium]